MHISNSKQRPSAKNVVFTSQFQLVSMSTLITPVIVRIPAEHDPAARHSVSNQLSPPVNPSESLTSVALLLVIRLPVIVKQTIDNA